MSVLTKPKIIQAIKKGKIKIEPLDMENIGPASIDLSLSNKFRIFKGAGRVHDVNEATNYQEFTKQIETDTISIKPGETILGMTAEKITLASDICGWLEGRSRFARLGLMVHISSSFMHPGIDSHQVLEISNMGQVPLRLHAGTKICQFIFEKTIGQARYKGRFVGQKEP